MKRGGRHASWHSLPLRLGLSRERQACREREYFHCDRGGGKSIHHYWRPCKTTCLTSSFTSPSFLSRSLLIISHSLTTFIFPSGPYRNYVRSGLHCVWLHRFHRGPNLLWNGWLMTFQLKPSYFYSRKQIYLSDHALDQHIVKNEYLPMIQGASKDIRVLLCGKIIM